MNLDFLLDKVRRTVKSHDLGDGNYARYLWQSPEGDRRMGPNEYGCADAANILYILGDFPRDPAEREKCVKALQAFQHPDTGVFEEPTHHYLHCTAHCTAALELFDALPAYPLKALDQFMTKEGLYGLLEGLGWTVNPWNESHKGAGVFASQIITRNAPMEWQDWYFDWFTQNVDPEWGLGKAGTVDPHRQPVFFHLNGWFHYLFNFNFAKRPFPLPEKLVDTLIDLYKNDLLSGIGPTQVFGGMIGFREIDWVFVLHRASRQAGYRLEEAKALLRDFAGKYIPYLESVDENTHDQWNDLHMLFGALCAVAELQLALPGELKSLYPLKQILDRRPFI